MKKSNLIILFIGLINTISVQAQYDLSILLNKCSGELTVCSGESITNFGAVVPATAYGAHNTSDMFWSVIPEEDPNNPNPYGIEITNQYVGTLGNGAGYMTNDLRFYNTTDKVQTVRICATLYSQHHNPSSPVTYTLEDGNGNPVLDANGNEIEVTVGGNNPARLIRGLPEEIYAQNNWTRQTVCCDIRIKPTQTKAPKITGPEYMCGDGPYTFCIEEIPTENFNWSIPEGWEVEGPDNEKCITLKRDPSTNTAFYPYIYAEASSTSGFCKNGFLTKANFTSKTGLPNSLQYEVLTGCDGLCTILFDDPDDLYSFGNGEYTHSITSNSSPPDPNIKIRRSNGKVIIYGVPCEGISSFNILNSEGCSGDLDFNVGTYQKSSGSQKMNTVGITTRVDLNQISSTPCMYDVSLSNNAEDHFNNKIAFLDIYNIVWKDQAGTIVQSGTGLTSVSLPPGTYTVEIIGEDGCITTKEIEVPPCSIIIKDDDIDVTVYPNPNLPVNDHINVSLNLNHAMKISVNLIDNSQNVLYSKNYGHLNSGAHSLTIDHGPLQVGNYWAQFIFSNVNGSVTKISQIVVQ